MEYPRYSGIRTFMRLPNETNLEDVDFLIAGVPFDTGSTYRVGARFGPAAIRNSSVLLRPYNPALDIAIFDFCSGVDFGDLPTTPGYLPESHQQIETNAAPIFESSATPIFLGGDHSISLPLLRGAAKTHGPLALIHLDSHGDVWPGYFGGKDTHGTPFARAVEEGLVNLEHSLQIGLRGSTYNAQDIQTSRDLGFQVITGPELHEIGIKTAVEIIREQVGSAKVYLSFDIDFVDPAYAPGTGTPEVGGFTGAQAQQLLRGLVGLNFIGFDLVEVMPQYDPAGITSLLAANLVYEFISLEAINRKNRSIKSVHKNKGGSNV
jgi:agmatinase